jgi:hypothetical protein
MASSMRTYGAGMSDAANDSGSRSKGDPATNHPEDLPDVFGEDPDNKKPLVEDGSVDPEHD